jgi:hypothetical protein
MNRYEMLFQTHTFNRKMWIDTSQVGKMTRTKARWIICQYSNGLEKIKDESDDYHDCDGGEGKGGWF